MKLSFSILKKTLDSINPEFRKPQIKRDPSWTAVSKQMIMDAGNKCSLCGKSENLITHHIIPVHIDKSLELNPNNLIVLCENLTHNCHFITGHLLSWRSYNSTVIDDVKYLHDKIMNRP